jgi:superfamily II DNA or RNA helicase
MKVKAQKDAERRLREVSNSEERVLLATGRYLGEGLDDARLDTLFLAMPISWRGLLSQYAGRLHRLHPTKRDVMIYDYVDAREPMLLSMSVKRRAGYRTLGYTEVSADETPSKTKRVPAGTIFRAGAISVHARFWLQRVVSSDRRGLGLAEYQELV